MSTRGPRTYPSYQCTDTSSLTYRTLFPETPDLASLASRGTLNLGPLKSHILPCQDPDHPPAGLHHPQDPLSPGPAHQQVNVSSETPRAPPASHPRIWSPHHHVDISFRTPETPQPDMSRTSLTHQQTDTRSGTPVLATRRHKNL